MKYIDADLLRKEIEKRKQIHFNDYFVKKSGNPADYGASNALAQVLPFIDSLQQEQPEVDLEKEMNLWISENENIHHGDKLMIGLLKDIAHHFYELGKNSK